VIAGSRIASARAARAVFPPEHDRRFAEKAGPVLDLYQHRFEGRRLRPDEYVICADEKTHLQALGRRHPTLPPAPGQACRVEFDGMSTELADG
jgi:hypothetical protein